MQNSDLQRIVNKLQASEFIEQELIYHYTSSYHPQISMYIGLMTCLYNLTVDQAYFQRFHNPQQKLYLKGNLLGELSKSLKLAPPLNHFASYQYSQFEKYCTDKQLFYLLRHFKGVYPKFNCQHYLVLQFLPLFQQIKKQKSQNFIIGNQDWQTARKVIQSYYTNQLKQTVLKYWDSDWNSLGNTLKLFYIILLGITEQIDEFITLVQKGEIINNKVPIQYHGQLAYQVRLWFDNYKKFIEEGIEMYLDKQLKGIQIFQIGFDHFGNSMKLQIIRVIKDMLQGYNQMGMKDNLIEIAQFFIHKLEAENNVDRFLLLGFCHKILGILDQDRSEQPIKIIYQKLGIFDEYFDRVFLKEQQILQRYEQGLIKEIPKFKYSPKMMEAIYSNCFKNNYSKLLKDRSFERQFMKLDHALIVKVLSENQILGEITKSSDESCDSQQILEILNKVQLAEGLELNKQLISKEYGEDFIRNFQQFKRLWNNYYMIIKNSQKHHQTNNICQLIKLNISTSNKLTEKMNNIQKLIDQKRQMVEKIDKQNQEAFNGEAMRDQSMDRLQSNKFLLQKEISELKTFKFYYPIDSPTATQKLFEIISDEIQSHVKNISEEQYIDYYPQSKGEQAKAIKVFRKLHHIDQQPICQSVIEKGKSSKYKEKVLERDQLARLIKPCSDLELSGSKIKLRNVNIRTTEFFSQLSIKCLYHLMMQLYLLQIYGLKAIFVFIVHIIYVLKYYEVKMDPGLPQSLTNQPHKLAKINFASEMKIDVAEH